MKTKLSDPSVLDVELADVSDVDYLYYVDDETKRTKRLRVDVLRAAVGGGGGGAAPTAHAASHASGGSDAVTPALIGAAEATATATALAACALLLQPPIVLSADTTLTDAHSGRVIFVDTTAGARTLTIPPTLAAGWNAVIVREGVNTLNIVGSTVLTDTMLMKGPAAVANAVAIAVDDGGVSVLKRSATKCWCAGKVS